MCVERHENVHNDEQSSSSPTTPTMTTAITTTMANNAIDVMAEKIESNTRNRTNTYQIDSDMVSSTSLLMEADEALTTTTNPMEQYDSKCHANGAMV